jgi:SHS2 domain-containing protein
MEASPAGFREIEHTADWELEVWAPDLPMLLEQAARGMNALCGARLKDGPRSTRSLRFPVHDAESLLVSFLSEILFLGESEKLTFDRFQLALQDDLLIASLEGAPLESLDKEIKAVTYHNLLIRHTSRGMEARIVFDV